ncbi:Uncharacterised protein [Corynebacterium renale]|nr:Uncharacterised protein [Corynebacterium renale]
MASINRYMPAVWSLGTMNVFAFPLHRGNTLVKR